MTRISPSELIKTRIEGAAGIAALDDPIVVEVARLSAAPYVDIVDALLSWSLKGPCSWEDANGNGRRCRGLLPSLTGIAGDALALPFQLVRHSLAAKRCAAAGSNLMAARLEDGGLYLRMDHLFGLKSGGSVAHTAGVINGLRQFLPKLSVISTDALPMVQHDENFHVVTPTYGVGRNIPLIPNLTFSCEVVRWWREHELPRPGFVYGRYSVGNYTGPMLRNLLGVPYVCEYNGSAIWIARNWGGKPLRFERVFMAIEDANLSGADLIVVVSEASRDELVQRGYPYERILVNPNGVDHNIYNPDISPEPIRDKLKIKPDELVIGFMGTFGRWHGVEILAEAFARLMKHQPELRSSTRLLLIGDGITMPETRKCLEEHQVLDRVIMPGMISQSEGPAYLACCDILTSPHVPNIDNTRFFGSPTKLFEYMAMGKAIVASNLEQIGQVLDHGHSGYLVSPGDVDEFTEALSRLARAPEMRKRLGAASRNIAVKEFTWQQHTQRILKRLATIS